MANIVKFYSLTPSEYENQEKNENYLYFVVEDDSSIGALYKGATLITDNSSLSSIREELSSLADIVQAHLNISANLDAQLTTHINDTNIHITTAEREKWNNKINCSVDEEILILTI